LFASKYSAPNVDVATRAIESPPPEIDWYCYWY